MTEPDNGPPSKDDFPDDGAAVAVAEAPKEKPKAQPAPKPAARAKSPVDEEVVDPGAEEQEIEIDEEPAPKAAPKQDSTAKREPADGDEKEGSKKKPEHEEAEEDDSGFTKELLARANDYGFDEKEARLFKTPEALETALDIHERRFVAQSRKALEEAKTAQAVPEKPAPAPKPKAVVKPEALPESDDEIPDFPEGEFDERLTAPTQAMRKIVKEQREQIRSLGEMVENLVRHALNRQAIEEDRAHDAWLDGLNGPFKDVFGGKAGDRREKSSQAYQNAFKLHQAKQFLRQLYHQNGRQVDEAEIGRRALAAEFGDITRLSVTQELSDKAHARARGFNPRPTNRNGDANRRVVSEVAKKIAQIREREGSSPALQLDDKDGLL